MLKVLLSRNFLILRKKNFGLEKKMQEIKNLITGRKTYKILSG